MVYIRPSSPVATPTVVKPVGDSSSAPEQHSLAGDVIVNEFVITPETDRRRQDRRQGRKNRLFETRSGKDRRKSTTLSISI